MSWSLSASGHTNSPEHEKSLFDHLRDVLSDPEHGCTGSTFSGMHGNSGAVHIKPEPKEAGEASGE